MVLLGKLLLLAAVTGALALVVCEATPVAIVSWLVAAAMWGHVLLAERDLEPRPEVAFILLMFAIAQAPYDRVHRHLGDALFVVVNWIVIAGAHRASTLPRARARFARRAACSNG
jgi:hypothetical protein